jgi:hypothetical protein
MRACASRRQHLEPCLAPRIARETDLGDLRERLVIRRQARRSSTRRAAPRRRATLIHRFALITKFAARSLPFTMSAVQSPTRRCACKNQVPSTAGAKSQQPYALRAARFVATAEAGVAGLRSAPTIVSVSAMRRAPDQALGRVILDWTTVRACRRRRLDGRCRRVEVRAGEACARAVHASPRATSLSPSEPSAGSSNHVPRVAMGECRNYSARRRRQGGRRRADRRRGLRSQRRGPRPQNSRR